MNHCVQETLRPTVLPTSSRARGLGARAVMNIELVTQVAASAVHMM